VPTKRLGTAEGPRIPKVVTIEEEVDMEPTGAVTEVEVATEEPTEELTEELMEEATGGGADILVV
jgi:hypothetical protein